MSDEDSESGEDMSMMKMMIIFLSVSWCSVPLTDGLNKKKKKKMR